jgi:hypothetical protein
MKEVTLLMDVCIYLYGFYFYNFRFKSWMTGIRFPSEAKEFSLGLCIQTGSGARPALYPMGTGGPYPGGKAARV